MSWWERLGVFVLVVLAVAGLALLPRAAHPYRVAPVWEGAPRFSMARAWADATTVADRFPRRWSGGPDRRAAADWLAAVLTEMGLEVQRAAFTAALGPREPVTLENVWAVSRGTDRADEIVVAMGNYDMAPTSYQAASDTIGHLATVLELARVFAAAPHRRTLVFFFPDGEEWGMLGARYFARTMPDRERIVAVLSIEDLDTARFQALAIDGIGQFHGFAPQWLRALATAAAAREGYPTLEVGPLFEWLQRSVLVSFTDQGPFLGEGLPAIQLGGRGDDPALQRQVYHRPGDTIDHMRPASLLAYGRIQERLLRSIDALAAVPRESDDYLQIAPDRIVTLPALAVLQALVFLPLAASLLVRLRRSRPGLAGVGREGLRAGLLVLAMLVGLAVLKAMPAAGLMPDYDLYPATSRHPVFRHVSWEAVLVVALAVTLALLAVRALRRRLRPPGPPGPPGAGIAALLLWLLAVAVVGFADNPFGVVTFLLLPAMLWIWVEPRSTVLGRLGNVLLVGAGFLVLVALFAQYAAILEIGPYILWYVFMGLAYGQFSALRVVLTFATVAIAWQLLSESAGARAST